AAGGHGIAARFFFSSRRRHTRCLSDWSSDVCSSDLEEEMGQLVAPHVGFVGEDILRRREGEGAEEALYVGDLARIAPGDRARPRSEERRVGKEWRTRRSAVH